MSTIPPTTTPVTPMDCETARASFLEDDAVAPDVQSHLDTCADCQAILPVAEEMKASLSEEWLWAEVDAAQDDQVVAAIMRDVDGEPRVVATSPAHTNARAVTGPETVAPVASLAERRSRRDRFIAIGASVAAAAAIVVAVIAIGTRGTTGTGSTTGADVAQVALSGTDLAPGVAGSAAIAPTSSGVRIDLDATGLPRRDNGKFYEAWLKGPNGLVPIGTFHTGEKVILWAGVSTKDYPTITVTEEDADGNQASSGRVVLTGTVSGG